MAIWCRLSTLEFLSNALILKNLQIPYILHVLYYVLSLNGLQFISF